MPSPTATASPPAFRQNINRISMPCRTVMQRYSNARSTDAGRRRERVYDRY